MRSLLFVVTIITEVDKAWLPAYACIVFPAICIRRFGLIVVLMTERQEGQTMARLPIEGSDVGNWGELLNTFLRIEHAEDGTLKSSGSLSTKYTWPLGGIPKADLSAAVQASLQRADIAL